MDNFISPTGSQAISVYTRREEMVYGIYENELDSLSSHNTISVSCFSISAWILSLIPIDSIILDKPFEWKTLNTFIIIVSIIFLIFGSIHWWKKRGLTQKIKNKSKVIEQKLSSYDLAV